MSDPEPNRAVERDARNVMNGFLMLRTLKSRTAALAVFDPQYRAVMDKMRYGNEGARQIERARLRQQSDHEIACFVEEIARVLKPSGHLMLWVDKFTIGSGHHVRYLRHAPSLEIVDLICWNKLRFGMGVRSRSGTEYLIVLQKKPLRAKNIWIDHSILDTWTEMTDRAVHPHAKPAVLTERLIRAVTRRGDLVIDPAAGGYGVLAACQRSGRRFIGCDIAEAA